MVRYAGIPELNGKLVPEACLWVAIQCALLSTVSKLIHLAFSASILGPPSGSFLWRPAPRNGCVVSDPCDLIMIHIHWHWGLLVADFSGGCSAQLATMGHMLPAVKMGHQVCDDARLWWVRYEILVFIFWHYDYHQSATAFRPHLGWDCRYFVPFSSTVGSLSWSDRSVHWVKKHEETVFTIFYTFYPKSKRF